jgi:putative transposase
MSGPAPLPLTLSSRQQALLERLVRRQTSPQRLVWRAKIVLAAATAPQHKNDQIARRLRLARETVRRWRQRWAEAQPTLAAVEAASSDDADLTELVLALLADEPRSGAPGVFTSEQIVQIVALACEEPAASQRPVSHWTPRELADEAVKRGIVARISPRSVGRFLKASGPQAASEPVLAERRPG